MSNDKMREALMQIRNALQLANHMGGPICDTIWMPNTPETLFDFIDSTLSAQASAEPLGYITKHGADLLQEKRGYSTNIRGPLACEYEKLDIYGMVAVYTHPPRAASPVVPEAIEPDDAPEMIPDDEEDMKNAYADGWNACRQALLATSAPSEPVEQAWNSSRRGALLSAAAGVSELYRNHCHHHGVDGLLNRCKQLEQVFIADADTDATSERSAHQTVIDYHAAFNGDVGALAHASAPLLPSEPKRVELTDAEIVVVMREGYGCRENDEQDHIEFARAIIAAHEAKQSGSV